MSAPLLAIVFPEWLRANAFTIGPFEVFGQTVALPVQWYGLAYMAGFLLGWRYVTAMIRETRLWAPGRGADAAEARPVMTVRQADDFFVWVILGVLVGGRLGSVIFYTPDMIWTDPVQIIAFWNGGLRGMSFHGGLIGVTLAILIFARRQRINPVRLGDLLAPAAPISIFLVRLTNFVNAELWGRPTDAPWGVVFCNDNLRNAAGLCPAGDIPRHPSQLYEAAMEGLILFALLLVAVWMYRSLTRPGFNAGLFLAGYGVSRFLLEFVRQPDAHMPDFPLGLTMGMMLSAPMIAAGAALMAFALRRPPVRARPEAAPA